MARSKIFSGKRYFLHGVYTTKKQLDHNKSDVKVKKGWRVRTTREDLTGYRQCRGGAHLLWVRIEEVNEYETNNPMSSKLQ